MLLALVASSLVCAQILPPDPAEVGKWVSKFNHPQNGDLTWPERFNAVHMALIPVSTATTGVEHRGHVIVWDIPPAGSTKQRWAIVDPLTGTAWNFRLDLPGGSNVSPGQGDFFCSAQGWTARGDLFVAGGSLYAVLPADTPSGGAKLAYLWDPRQWHDPSPSVNRGWYQQPDLASPRYYAIVMRMADDGMVVAGGVDYASTYKNYPNQPLPSNYEVFRQTSNHAGVWDTDTAGNRIYQGPTQPAADVFLFYARMHPQVGPTDVPSGWMFYAGFGKNNARSFHNPASTATVWDTSVGADWEMPPLPHPLRRYLHYGSTIPQPVDLNVANPALDRVMRFGGGFAYLEFEDGVVVPTPRSTVETCDTRASGLAAQWQVFSPSMQEARMFANAVILPDGTPFLVGGVRTYAHGPVPCPCEFVQNAEFLRNGVWTKTPPMASRRGYHSVALLHPSGAVIVGAGNEREWDWEVYEPTYFYTGTRPTILTAPAVMHYGETYTIGYHLPSGSEHVQKVVLTRPGAVTHHSCSEQRWIALEQPSEPLPLPGYVNCKAPPNSKYAQRGWWMLWLVTNFGTASVAAWVEIKD